MIDRELIGWAMREAATGAATTDDGAVQAPDLDIEALGAIGAGYGARMARYVAMGIPPEIVVAAAFSHGFCVGVAAARAEQVGS